jgi:hypothetical protein
MNDGVTPIGKANPWIYLVGAIVMVVAIGKSTASAGRKVRDMRKPSRAEETFWVAVLADAIGWLGARELGRR